MNLLAQNKAKIIVDSVLADLCDRKGIGDELDVLDADIYQEMSDDFLTIVLTILEDDGTQGNE